MMRGVNQLLPLCVAVFGFFGCCQAGARSLHGSPLRVTLTKNSDVKPLLLTPLLNSGHIEKAQQKSKVQLPGVPVAGHAGYITIPTASGSGAVNNFFFWFQPCIECSSVADAPFLEWFQGGPGGPGYFGSLVEVGQWYVDEEAKLKERCFTWCRQNSCLFVDQPATVGNSFQLKADGSVPTHSEIEYTATTPEAMEAQYQVLSQIVRIFPSLQHSPYYVTGESYGGNYVGWMGYTVWKHNEQIESGNGKDIKINLKGVAVGDPCLNWVYQMPKYADMFYGQGVVMEEGRDELRALFSQSVKYLKQGMCIEAFNEWNKVWNDDGSAPKPFLFKALTGADFTEDFLVGNGGPAGMNNFAPFIASNLTATAMHYAGAPEQPDPPADGVYQHMVRSGDWCSNSSGIYAKLLFDAKIDVMIYSSNNDPILGPPTTEAGIQAMWDNATAVFPGAAERAQSYYKQRSGVWFVDSTKDVNPAGYSRCSGGSGGDPRFCYVVVRNAGHMTPAFAPRPAYDMIRRFIDGSNFDSRGDAPSKTPKCAACGGVGPLAGPALPECAPKQSIIV